MQGRHRWQAGRALPRADRALAARCQKRRPPFCRAELGARRRLRAVGTAVANVAGQTPGDIPWLKLEVTAHRGNGSLSGVTTVQRINTRGGVHAGSCDNAGALYSAPYSADYVFLKK